jgi:hypothetical protein
MGVPEIVKSFGPSRTAPSPKRARTDVPFWSILEISRAALLSWLRIATPLDDAILPAPSSLTVPPRILVEDS